MENNPVEQGPVYEPNQNNEKRFPVFAIFLFFVLLVAIAILIFLGILLFGNNKKGDNLEDIGGARSVTSSCSSVDIIFSQLECDYIQNGSNYKTNLSFMFEEVGTSFSNLSYWVSFQSGNPSSEKISLPSANELNKINFTFRKPPKDFHLFGDLATSDENSRRSCYSQTVSCILIGVIEENLQEEPEEEPEEESGSGSIPPPPPLPD